MRGPPERGTEWILSKCSRSETYGDGRSQQVLFRHNTIMVSPSLESRRGRDDRKKEWDHRGSTILVSTFLTPRLLV